MELQKVRIKDWDFIQKNAKTVNPVPEMEQYCGKEVTIVDCVVPSVDGIVPGIYTIFEDGGKYWWLQDWMENIE